VKTDWVPSLQQGGGVKYTLRSLSSKILQQTVNFND
jgi:hypothetical protein